MTTPDVDPIELELGACPTPRLNGLLQLFHANQRHGDGALLIVVQRAEFDAKWINALSRAEDPATAHGLLEVHEIPGC